MCRSALLVSLAFLFTLSAGGCGGLLPEPGPASVFYHLDYDPPPVDCLRSFGEGVRIREFSAASPYDRTEMTVLKPAGEVRFSGAYQWVAPPGRMVAESLGRDLSTGDLFSAVSMNGDPSFPPLELTGRIYTFAWEPNEGGERAVLTVGITLSGTVGGAEIHFNRIYRLGSPSQPGGKAPLFASAMSELVRDLSVRLQQDLCSLAQGEESAPK
ncbi:MAG: membrane integrity-associated transporter subunit PqiC [Desulfuromonadales bacterium]|nr:membrane integrity-associated transporter subunit PqiC [Desulfuromonadales bacterium]